MNIIKEFNWGKLDIYKCMMPVSKIGLFGSQSLSPYIHNTIFYY